MRGEVLIVRFPGPFFTQRWELSFDASENVLPGPDSALTQAGNVGRKLVPHTFNSLPNMATVHGSTNSVGWVVGLRKISIPNVVFKLLKGFLPIFLAVYESIIELEGHLMLTGSISHLPIFWTIGIKTARSHIERNRRNRKLTQCGIFRSILSSMIM